MVQHDVRQQHVWDENRLIPPGVTEAGSIARKAVGRFPLQCLAGQWGASGQCDVAGVIVRLERMMHIAHQRDLMHDSRSVWQIFTDMQTRYGGRDRLELTTHFRRCVRFHVKGVNVAGSAIIENEDARPNFALNRYFTRHCRLYRLQLEKPWKTQSQ